jgi:deoxyribodipyrimidine photolyase
MDARMTAARLLDTDDPVGVHGWPLACYVSEAIENEMAAFTPREQARPYDARFTLAVRRAANLAAVYAEPWQLDPPVFRAAVELRKIAP